MKREIILVVTGFGLLAGTQLHAAPNIEFNQLPSVVQKAINATKQQAEVMKVERDVAPNGKTFYEVRMRGQGGAARTVFFREDGSQVSQEQMNRPDFAFKKTRKTLNQLPKPAQDAIRSHIGSAKVDEIDQQTIAGRTVYEVEYETNGRIAEFLVAADGSLVNDPRYGAGAGATAPGTAATAGSGKVQFSELPRAVQRTVKSQVGAAEVEDIDRNVRDGKTTFEVAFKKNGVNTELLIAEDGALLNTSTTPGERGTAATAETPLSGASKVALSEVPEAARRIILREAGTAEVEDIDKGMLNGRIVYEAAFKRNGVHTELRVKEDGTVLSGGLPRASVTSVAPAPTAPAPLSGAGKVALSEVPEAARKVIQREAGSATVEDIDKGMLNGRTVYEAAFKRNGVHTEVRVAEDGTLLSGGAPVIKESAGAAARPDASPAPVGTPAPVTVANESRKVQFYELPAAVQKAVRDQAGSAEIEDIDKETRNGKTTYEAAFKKDGKNVELRVNEDGSLAK